jgi:lipoprotein-anchoring transpeptidase ErfK/SrfK
LLLGGCQPPAAPKPDPHGQAATEHKPTHLVLRLSERRVYLVDDNKEFPTESFPVAIGKDGFETPTGQYHVEEMVVHPDFVKYDNSVTPARPIKYIPPGPLNPLGERWIGFAHGEGWTLGFHGTPNPELLGQAVSHGCVRMRNADVVKVYDRVQVGTPVFVEP